MAVIEVEKPQRESPLAKVNNEELRERVDAAKAGRSKDKWVVLDYREVTPRKDESYDRALERAERSLRSSQRYKVKRINDLYGCGVPESGQGAAKFPRQSVVFVALGLISSNFVAEINGKSAAVWATRRA